MSSAQYWLMRARSPDASASYALPTCSGVSLLSVCTMLPLLATARSTDVGKQPARAPWSGLPVLVSRRNHRAARLALLRVPSIQPPPRVGGWRASYHRPGGVSTPGPRAVRVRVRDQPQCFAQPTDNQRARHRAYIACHLATHYAW